MSTPDGAANDARRFYRSPREGEVTGPFTRAEIDAAVARGEVRAGTLLCVEGSTQWQPASVVLFGMAADDDAVPAAPTAPGIATPQTNSLRPDIAPQHRVSLVGPVVATVLSLLICCLPIGAVPLVLAFLANAKYEAGDVAGGMRAERQARGWMTATWILLVLSCAINAWMSYAMLDAVGDMFDQMTRMR